MGGIRTSLAGIQNALERQRVAAANVAGAVVGDDGAWPVEPISGVTDGVRSRRQGDGRDRVDISEQAVELMQAEHDVAINARVLQRLDELDDALMRLRDEPE